jgi:predicted house-cleaning noncanonical NTP pyrophosphatase (MazG superfamily)
MSFMGICDSFISGFYRGYPEVFRPAGGPFFIPISGDCLWYNLTIKKFKQGSLNMPIYNKLVRDRIPEIIEKAGKTFTSRILTQDEYIEALRKKSHEELDEYMNATDTDSALEELADLLEIIHALAEAHGSTAEEVEKIRAKKAEERGGFKGKIFLIEVED